MTLPRAVPAEMERRAVVTAFLRHDGRILLLRRSDRVGSYRGRWAGVSGFLEDPTALAQALREIREETGLPADRLRLARAGAPLEVLDRKLEVCWIVHPFLFDLDDASGLRLDWEHVESCWVRPEEVKSFETVPALAEALSACLEVGETDG
ncbi:NUDIX pyrophosphatase [Desulfuromonas sp.]|uniref:NUDIX pyrophosphatase n=1 Tax=Desulfuromonas sp. TaxID=892 RepID=UPI0025BEFC8E|nr:NUDIX pyrophosphatase [Desulfuromonas sp.]